jgi:hypothetical protein
MKKVKKKNRSLWGKKKKIGRGKRTGGNQK